MVRPLDDHERGESDATLTSDHEATVEVLLDESLPFDVDWAVPADALDEETRLARLARVKALLPVDNAHEEKSTHDVTLENYIRLALQAAGDKESLRTFLQLVHGALASRQPGVELLAQQVFWIWGPAAEIADLHHLKNELEARAFEVSHTKEFELLRDMYEAADPAGMARFLLETRQTMFDAVSPAISGIAFEDVTARLKSYYKIWRKKEHPDRDEQYEVSDFAGFRIVVDGSTEEEAVGKCYAVVGEICKYFEMDPDRFKNYIVQPKANGYRSLHLTLYTERGQQLELQIRTRAMDSAIETDNSHMLYDAAYKQVPGKLLRPWRKIPGHLVWREQAVQAVRENPDSIEVVGDELLFFRSDGNLYRTEAGATALDGAFRIHSQGAMKARAIFRNGKPINFATRLRYGDVLHVEYGADYPTTPLQLEGLRANSVTERAHTALNKAKRKLLRDEFIEAGKLRVKEILGQMGIHVGLAELFIKLDDKDRRKLADSVGAPTFEDMLFLAGMPSDAKGGGKPGRIANLIKARMGFGDPEAIKFTLEGLSTLKDEEVLALIRVPSVGGQLPCKIAGCCSQKIEYGEIVMARPIRAEGMLSIHRGDCVNIRNPAGLFECSWDTSDKLDI